jgi:hypothetical protein
LKKEAGALQEGVCWKEWTDDAQATATPSMRCIIG